VVEQGLASLQELDIAETKVTDAGLAHLKGLIHLETLKLRHDEVTDAAVNELAKALPGLRIENNW